MYKPRHLLYLYKASALTTKPPPPPRRIRLFLTRPLFIPMSSVQNGIDKKFTFASFTKILIAKHLLGLIAQISTCKHLHSIESALILQFYKAITCKVDVTKLRTFPGMQKAKTGCAHLGRKGEDEALPNGGMEALSTKKHLIGRLWRSLHLHQQIFRIFWNLFLRM